jgi:hypothetical protein
MEPSVAKHLVGIIGEDLLAQGVEFECNTDLPASHPTALWSTKRTRRDDQERSPLFDI